MQTKDSARAVCPWYEWSTEKLIVCAGTEPGQTIRMQFRGRKKKEQWFERISRLGKGIIEFVQE